MATFTKKSLSGSTTGLQIKVTGASAGAAVTIHTAVAGTSSLDEVWIYAYNEDTVARLLSIQWGGTTEPDNVIRTVIPPKSGRVLVVDGMLLQNGLLVKAYADAANMIILDGFVNNIA
jgi:hypothetical protein